MLGLVKKISVGICGDAKAAAVALGQRLAGRTLACDATKAERAAKIAAEKAAWEKELDDWTHERDPYSLDMIDENGKEKTFSGGSYLPDALSTVNHFLRDFRTGDVHEIDAGLLDLLHSLTQLTGTSKAFQVISGYRSPKTNDMLRQQSGWIGTLWGKPWWADRPDPGKPWSELAKGPPPVGKAWKYNDVRVNALALALTHLWKRPLPEVLKENIADPIGMSDSWHWEGYDNSWTTIDGKRTKVVSGGGHWGGGMFLTAYDQARLGLLGLNNFCFSGHSLLSA
jgi:hypothetical protein